MPSERARGNGHKQKHKRFCLNIRKLFFSEDDRVLAQVAQSVCEVALTEILKIHLEIILVRVLYMALLEQGKWKR